MGTFVCLPAARRRGPVFAALLFGCACSGVAETAVYWKFDDAERLPCTVTSLVDTAGLAGLQATCASGAPAFSSEVIPSPTRQISHGNKGEVVNANNRSSVFFDGKSKLTASGTFRPAAFTVEAFIKVNAHHDYPLIIGKLRDRAKNTATWSLSVSGNS